MPSRRTSISVGDRFARTNQADKSYVVYAIDRRTGFPVHARLHDESYDKDQITVSLDALSDPRLFTRLGRQEGVD